MDNGGETYRVLDLARSVRHTVHVATDVPLESPAPPGRDGRTARQLATLHRRLRLAERGAMIGIEGGEGIGGGSLMRDLAAALDPHATELWRMSAPRQLERERHFLWRFWLRVPAAGQVALFNRGWYGAAFAAADAAQRQRMLDEINEFEAQQAGHGVVIVKLLLKPATAKPRRSPREQLSREWLREGGTPTWFGRLDGRRLDEAVEQTDTRWAPWTVLGGATKRQLRADALAAVAARLDTVLGDATELHLAASA